MEPADFVAALIIFNKLLGEGQKLAITLNGKELEDEELFDKITALQVRILKNKEDD